MTSPSEILSIGQIVPKCMVSVRLIQCNLVANSLYCMRIMFGILRQWKLVAEIVATPSLTYSTSLSYRLRSPKIGNPAAVIPLFKGGATLDPNCYRHKSILPCISKVFESQVNKQITDHLDSHRTFSVMQSGFRAGHGGTSATLKVLNDFITAIDKRHYCAAVFIDLAKAFDSYRQTQQPWFF